MCNRAQPDRYVDLQHDPHHTIFGSKILLLSEVYTVWIEKDHTANDLFDYTTSSLDIELFSQSSKVWVRRRLAATCMIRGAGKRQA